MKVMSLMGSVMLCLAAPWVRAAPDAAQQPRYILMVSPKRVAVAPARAAEEKDSLLPRSPTMKNLLEQVMAGKSIAAPEPPLARAAVPLVIDLKRASPQRDVDDSSGAPAGPEYVPAAVEVSGQSPAGLAIQAHAGENTKLIEVK